MGYMRSEAMNAITSNLGLNALLAAGEPAGGAALDQVVIATGAALVLSAAIAWLGMGHRSGRVPYLGRAADLTERVSGLPGWAALPTALAAASLLVALLGMYWDISLHIDAGRDAGPLANPAHYLILAGLFGIFSAGYLAICLPKERPGPAAVRIAGDWYAPVGGLLIAACGAFALIGFPLDDVWHRLFGQDVTLWGPTHLMLIGGAGHDPDRPSGAAGRGDAGARSRRPPTEPLPAEPALIVRLRRVGLMGGLLIGLSTFQAEFDFGVPQFRLVLEPVLLAVAASVALVCARIWIGRGGALGAAAFFLAIRGGISLIVGDVFGRDRPPLPALPRRGGLRRARGPRARPPAPGPRSGLGPRDRHDRPRRGVGLVGRRDAVPWTADLLPEALIGAIVAARRRRPRRRAARLRACRGRAAAPAVARTVSVVGAARDRGRVRRRAVDRRPAERPGARDAPRRAARPGARGRAPPSASIPPRPPRIPPGSTSPRGRAAVWWSTGSRRAARRLPDHRADPGPRRLEGLIRLQRGREILGLPVYMPEDTAIPAPKVAAKQSFTRQFVSDDELLQRERKAGVPGWLTTVAPLGVLALALGFLTTLGWGLGRVARRTSESPPASRRRPSPRPRHLRPRPALGHEQEQHLPASADQPARS